MCKSLLPFVVLVCCATAVFGQNSLTATGKISGELRAAWLRGERPDLLVAFTEQADLSAARNIRGKDAKAEYVFARLRAAAEHSQCRARQILSAANASANSLYIVNAIAVAHCDPAVARQLAELPTVSALALDPWVEFPKPIREQADNLGPVDSRDAVEWGVEKINAPAVWALGFTGQGITVGGADTGYDWTHPALQPHYRGWNGTTANHNYNWHDAIHAQSPLSGDPNNPCGFNSTQPCDDGSHGTHTMGTMTGDDGQGNQIGVAPGAQWVACRNMERGNGQPSTYLECFEWFLAPTDLNGQNPNPAKSPHVINNSWYCSVGEGCIDLTVNELMRQAVIALRAAGVVVVVSNGNAGNEGCGSTDGPPAYFEESFSVGSTRINDTISGFSSRGPVDIDGSFRTKPNVSAPGSNVRSSTPGGNYSNFSGTSMAGPHVAGLVALVLSARPELIGEVELVEDIVESTCLKIDGFQDCSDNGGATYPNNTYGYGRVNALAAVQEALIVDITPSGTQNPGTAMSAVAAPNPTRDEVVLAVKNGTGMADLQVFNAQGQLLSSRRVSLDQTPLLPLSLTSQAAGTYFWQLRGTNGVLSGRAVKQ